MEWLLLFDLLISATVPLPLAKVLEAFLLLLVLALSLGTCDKAGSPSFADLTLNITVGLERIQLQPDSETLLVKFRSECD